MNAYNPTSWKKKIVLAAATLAVSAGVLEVVTSSMMYPNPEAMAVRARACFAKRARAAAARDAARRSPHRRLDHAGPHLTQTTRPAARARGHD